mmetsp:Transcript_3611/g.10649  ORF Transcript_3611/g.10649 Transcript_3611/m.10649 type:complete len:268 (+) Transcript_3611:1230-2033(+)
MLLGHLPRADRAAALAGEAVEAQRRRHRRDGLRLERGDLVLVAGERGLCRRVLHGHHPLAAEGDEVVADRACLGRAEGAAVAKGHGGFVKRKLGAAPAGRDVAVGVELDRQASNGLCVRPRCRHAHSLAVAVGCLRGVRPADVEARAGRAGVAQQRVGVAAYHNVNTVQPHHPRCVQVVADVRERDDLVHPSRNQAVDLRLGRRALIGQHGSRAWLGGLHGLRLDVDANDANPLPVEGEGARLCNHADQGRGRTRHHVGAQHRGGCA